MEGDYISRDAALKYIKSEQCKTCSDIGLCGNCAVLVAIKLLAKVPAADVVEVVRCKDCKHRTEYGNCGHPRQKGVLPSAYPFDFCSYGEYQTDTGGFLQPRCADGRRK